MILFILLASLETIADQFISAINNYRRCNYNLPLKKCEKLMIAARIQAEYEKMQGKCTHDGLDNDFDLSDRINTVRYNCSEAGENVAKCAEKDFTVPFELWKKNVVTKKNMLDENYNEIGVAYAIDDDEGYYYWACIFSRKIPTILNSND